MADLEGVRVLVTRPRAQFAAFAAALRAVGAQPIGFPVIEISPVADSTALDRAVEKLDCYDWVVLTSVNGVETFWARLQAHGCEGLPQGVKVAAIGPKTARSLLYRGIRPDFIPDEYVAEAIVPGLGDIKGRWVLLPRADIARPALPQAILDVGGVAHEIAVYHTLPASIDPDGLRALQAGLEVVTFTSSSTVRNFVDLVVRSGLDPRQLPGEPIFASIGPITTGTLQEFGLPVQVQAENYTIEGLIAGLLEYYSGGWEAGSTSNGQF